MLTFRDFFRTPPLPSISPSVTLPSSQELELDSFGFFSVFQARFRRLVIGLPRVSCYGSHATLREAGRDNDLTWYWIGKTLSPQEVPCNAGQVILLPGKQPTVIRRWFPACGPYVPVSGRRTAEVAIARQHAWYVQSLTSVTTHSSINDFALAFPSLRDPPLPPPSVGTYAQCAGGFAPPT
jgi:hypothetical protein